MCSGRDQIRLLGGISNKSYRMIAALRQQPFQVQSNFSMATRYDNVHHSTVLRDIRAPTMGWVALRSEPGPGKPAPKYDLAIARGIWVLTGLTTGLALGIFTGSGWPWLIAGLVAGVLAAIFRTRPEQRIEED